MKISGLFLAKATSWTLASFGLGQFFRLAANVALARLLAPELFGIMVIVNSVRTGAELLTDVGVVQSLVHNPKAEEPDFYNTAWTIQLIRAALLWLLCIVVAIPLASFYQTPVLVYVLPVSGLFIIITAFGAVAPALLQRRMRYARLNAFELVQQVISSSAHVFLAWLSPTIWALVIGGLVAAAARSAGTYFLLPGMRPRFRVSKDYLHQILSFGKWIFLSSIVYFLSMNFDRFYLGKIAIEALGVYGIARTFSELVSALVLRLNGFLVFPLVASLQTTPRHQLRAALSAKRLVFLVAAALLVALMTAISDFLILRLYDHRYHAAAWMLPILLIGVWFSTLTSLNEATLLGLGKSYYSAATNATKLTCLIASIPLAFANFGLLGVLIAIAFSNLLSYFPMLVGQIRERVSFVGQDIFATCFMFCVLGICEWLRWSFGLGTSFESVPIGAFAR